MPRSAPDSSLSPLRSAPEITVLAERPFRLDLQVRAEEPYTLRLHRFFFPGWRAIANGVDLPTSPSGNHAVVTVEFPAGDYAAAIGFWNTPARSLASIVSVFPLLSGSRPALRSEGRDRSWWPPPLSFPSS